MDNIKKTLFPESKEGRKDRPVCSGVLDYFSSAIIEVARISKIGNDQHNAGQPLHWARGKSMDHADCIARHLMERGTLDEDGARHSAKMAWRALALLQQELEDEGHPISRGSWQGDINPNPCRDIKLERTEKTLELSKKSPAPWLVGITLFVGLVIGAMTGLPSSSADPSDNIFGDHSTFGQHNDYGNTALREMQLQQELNRQSTRRNPC